MSAERRIHLMEIPAGGKAGFFWNRLHGEREDICEALLEDSGLLIAGRRELLEARLRKVDDALDRLISGSFGNCSRCGRAIDEARLEVDPALSVCLNCWPSDPGDVPRGDNPEGDVMTKSLNAFDTIMVRTQNSDYRVLLLDPDTGRALVEGGQYLAEPREALVRGSAIPGSPFKPGVICVGCRLEMWVDEQVFITSPIKSLHVKQSGVAESVEEISAALH